MNRLPNFKKRIRPNKVSNNKPEKLNCSPITGGFMAETFFLILSGIIK